MTVLIRLAQIISKLLLKFWFYCSMITIIVAHVWISKDKILRSIQGKKWNAWNVFQKRLDDCFLFWE